MKFLLSLAFSSLLLQSPVLAQVPNPIEADVAPVDYTDGNATLLGHLALPNDNGQQVPAIVIIPDWDGVNDYEQVRATMIANDWGFVAFAADIYGADLQFVENITERIELATYYRSNPDVFGSRIHAAVEYVKSLDQVDADQVALFGYCFGGTGVLQYGLNGNDDVEAIVSFHGGLSSLPEDPVTFGPKVLVLSGGEDDAASEVMDLEMTFDNVNASWEITRYSGIEHAFTVFSEERYNEWADRRSWESAYSFVMEIFGFSSFESAKPSNTTTNPVDYVDDTDGTSLRGHLAMPSNGWTRPLPAIVILPDWDGANTYEQERATALAELGYVAMVADIYGADLQYVESIDDRIALVGQYASNPDLYFSRIQKAIDQIKLLEDEVDIAEIAIAGYCFGGSGAVLYSFFGGGDAKVAVAFHGSLSTLPPVKVDNIVPYLLILSGGDDGLHGNQTIMEEAFNSGNASWEITRYAGVNHGFTVFDSDAYNVVADARSWDSMLSTLQELLAVPQIEGGEGDSEAPGTSPTESPGESGASGVWARYSKFLCLAILASLVIAL